MSLFRTLRVTRSLLGHYRQRVVLFRTIGALSALQYIDVHGASASQHILDPQSKVSDLCQQHQRWLSSESDEIATVDYEGLVALLQSGDIQLIDVREPDELVEFGKIDKSYNIPLSRLKQSLNMSEANFIEHMGREMPMKWDNNVVFYGLGPIKSRAAMDIAKKLGFKKARHYPGGWEEWSEKQGLPLKKTEL
ncbi:rhodanese domain-containing protein CG4456-like isoform X2 [Ptychodera flava]|uniref:rhodanese domain-containing protein CG4456-like isoform X2 n=1 Tax=Ptychodera flava TaxID=63121 RepID=UPI003969C737